MNKIIALLILTFFPLHLNALGRTVSYDELITQHFGTIQSMTLCGEYRLIKSYVYGGDMLFIDKIEFSDNYLKVVKGYTFKEFNNDHKELYIEKVTCKTKHEQTILLTGKVNGSGHQEDYKFNFEIILNTVDGSYSFSKK